MPAGYDRIGLYHDAADPRLLVPKRIRAMGWTINVDHRYGRPVLAALGLAVLAGLAAAYLAN
jgi:uncharacterized membrane protein